MTTWRRAFVPVTLAAICWLAVFLTYSALSDPLPPDTAYRPLPTRPFSEVRAADEAQKPEVMARAREVLNRRYDMSDRPITGVMMSGGRKAVQGGARVKLQPAGGAPAPRRR